MPFLLIGSCHVHSISGSGIFADTVWSCLYEASGLQPVDNFTKRADNPILLLLYHIFSKNTSTTAEIESIFSETFLNTKRLSDHIPHKSELFVNLFHRSHSHRSLKNDSCRKDSVTEPSRQLFFMMFLNDCYIPHTPECKQRRFRHASSI